MCAAGVAGACPFRHGYRFADTLASCPLSRIRSTSPSRRPRCSRGCWSEDKVPQWTSDLERYDVDGPLGEGTRVTQKLTVAGGIALDMEITEYDPPGGAATAFETNGVKVTSEYILDANGSGHPAHADARRQGQRLHGQDADPDRPGPARDQAQGRPRAPQEPVGSLSMRLIAVLVTLLAFPAAAAAQSVDEAAQALRSDPVYVAPDAELADQVDAPVLRGEIGEEPVFIAVLPESAVEGSPGRTLIALREARRREGPLRARDRRRPAHAPGRAGGGGARRAPGRPPGRALSVHRRGRVQRRRLRWRGRRGHRRRDPGRRRDRRQRAARQPPPRAAPRTDARRSARSTRPATSSASATRSARSSSTSRSATPAAPTTNAPWPPTTARTTCSARATRPARTTRSTRASRPSPPPATASPEDKGPDRLSAPK